MELLLSQEGSTDDKLMSLLHILTKQLVANEPMLGIFNLNFTYQIYQPDNLNSFFTHVNCTTSVAICTRIIKM